MDQQNELAGHARRTALQRLESLQRAGVMQISRRRGEMPSPLAATEHAPASESSSASPETHAKSPSEKTTTAQTSLFGSAERAAAIDGWPTSLPPEQRRTALEVLQREVAACTRCTELAEKRTQTVFGVGNSQTRLCFLGEAPGADEDAQGEPFVGRAGKLLTDIIQKGMGLKREDVYILNILKCRPPGNRNPSSTEAENCRPFLDRQLEIIQPEYICCLGSIAATNLLGTTQSIGRLRGRFHAYRGAKVLATYHPAYLLRNPSAKKDVWEDMKLLMREMGLEIPAGRK